MLDPTWATWINRVGLLLDFGAFLLAIPEFLGGRRSRWLGEARGKVKDAIEREQDWVCMGSRMLQLRGAFGDDDWEVDFREIVLSAWLVRRLVDILLAEDELRRKRLFWPVVMFVVGFVLQLVATF